MQHTQNGDRREDRKMAFLGPEGTYGQQAARTLAGYLPHPTYLVPCPTIADVYHHPAPYLVLPFENTIHGVVVETLGLLSSVLRDGSYTGTSSRLQNSPRIIAELRLPIRHCLVARKGVRLDQITVVRSHEQALGQSKTFLSAHLPQATLESYPSTAAAAQSILDPASQNQQGEVAAICSSAVLGGRDDLDLLWEGTQDHNHNYTRFFLLTRDPTQPPLEENIPLSNQRIFHYFADPYGAGPSASSVHYPIPLVQENATSNRPNTSKLENEVETGDRGASPKWKDGATLEAIYTRPTSSTSPTTQPERSMEGQAVHWGLLEIRATDGPLDLRDTLAQGVTGTKTDDLDSSRAADQLGVAGGQEDCARDREADKALGLPSKSAIYLGSCLRGESV